MVTNKIMQDDWTRRDLELNQGRLLQIDSQNKNLIEINKT
jgi:hypothetical protein